jgi:hypothetical protein
MAVAAGAAPAAERLPEPDPAPAAVAAAVVEEVASAAAAVAAQVEAAVAQVQKAAVPEPVLATIAAAAPPRHLVEGTIDLQGRMVAFAWRQTEAGLAAGRAMLASRSLPEMMALQRTFVGRSVEDALAHTLELTRLSAELMRTGLSAGRAR